MTSKLVRDHIKNSPWYSCLNCGQATPGRRFCCIQCRETWVRMVRRATSALERESAQELKQELEKD